ncbi:MAG TPA: ester cyclase [Anaerolineaceae bacterium]|nr:ester cyclase [Anaerolineaceae bacterium]
MASTPSPIRRIFDEAFNVGNLEVVDEVLAPDHHTHITIGGAPNGPQGLKLMIAIYRTAFPDLLCTVDDEIVEGDRVAARWTMRGTHKGLFLGNQPTGRPVEIQGMIFARLGNGRMVEDWTLIDHMGILQQIGVIPPNIRKER